ncbi:MAG: superoxide dismutase family protein [Betaproteobacteria bacterium]|nr:superoxide dismutase family protein [Betaproteobacteria bacterium]MDH3438016.1 superoxide dismutase family protein [Betaproteobacteria bacterium]
MNTKTALTMLAAAVLLAACQTTPDDPLRASAQLKPTKGNKTFGEVTFEQMGDKVRVQAVVQGLKPGGEYGFHIHEVGDCSSGDGMSAKGHFNPVGKPHGHYSSAERHAGDLPALKAPLKGNKRGRAKLLVDLDTISVEPGPGNIIGRGVIVHAGPDDYRTQPTGNAGARLACGVIRAE